jgi:hypothetical protein
MQPPLLLFSTTTFLKFRIQQDFRGEHFAWCSPTFSAETLNKYSLGSGTPPSSDPASIYRDLCDAVRRTDEHNPKINDHIKTLLALAVEWHNGGLITAAKRDDITMIVTKVPFSQWRPLIFVIPYAGVTGRVEEVPRDKRASMEPEYIIRDLRRHEFEIVELTS